MGVIRLLLAFAVIFSHAASFKIIPHYTASYGYHPVDATIAVQMFFVISGFYMSLILPKYRALGAGWVWKFYASRYARLMPAYLAIFSLSTWLFTRQFISFPGGTFESAVFRFSSLTLFGIDLTAFYSVPVNDTLAAPAHSQLAVPQAWSLGLEIAFYVLAPVLFLLRTRNLVLLTAAALAVLIGMDLLEVPEFPWMQRLYSSALFYFLLGMISHRIYEAFPNPPPTLRVAAFVSLVSVVTLVGHANGWRAWTPSTAILLCLIFAALLPMVFALTRHSKLDNAIGLFSYPVYLIQMLVIAVVPGALYSLWSLIALCVFCSIPIVLLIEIPVDRLRHALLKRSEPRVTGKAVSLQI